MTLWRRLMTLGLLMTTAFSLAATETDATLTFYVDAPAMNVWQEQDIEVGGWIWGGIEDPVERRAVEAQIADYGQTPRQLFRRPHPKRKLATEAPPLLQIISGPEFTAE